MSFFIEKEVECNFNFDYEKVAEAVVSSSLDHESCPYEAEISHAQVKQKQQLHLSMRAFRMRRRLI